MKKLTQEEIILYVFTFLIMLGVSAYFGMVFKETSNPKPESIIGHSGQDLFIDNSGVHDQYFIQVQMIKAHLQVVGKRYEMASRINNSIAYIKYISFAVGTFLCLLGVIVIFKGVRESPIKSEMSSANQLKFRISTTSPGAFVVFLGTVIICLSITYKSTIDVKDEPIKYVNSPTANTSDQVSSELLLSDQNLVVYNSLPPNIQGLIYRLNKKETDSLLSYIKAIKN
ncbi:hypothetical protein KO507_19170 [Gilvimarinus agarilyticus]|uniref:hypothetical protein n=1 Tax=Reichenbachiella agariperforans TaxID=156994 RepID=UPI001C09CC73|nr:hypothetical protein [Reichenbachiella agariperforans]MBU2887894.1 hypothetical protein [Gilvimarinus agarilyticus]MBU2912742.1 hypothetical protein [Reichenbachiella agariperforans]